VFLGRIIGKCPRCEGHLHEAESRGVVVGACDGCGGVWAEEGRLDSLLRQPEPVREQLIRLVERVRTGKIHKLNPGLLCPKCELVMLRAPMMVSSEPIESCTRCNATFLEDGVLAVMLRSGEVW
jgi:Zn-finger nucleic acid-binding protein